MPIHQKFRRTMTNNTPTSKTLDHTITAWLKERQELIVLYCALCGVRELSSTLEEQRVLEQLNSFCQVLVDYLSAGHFEIFESIIEQTKEASPEQDSFHKYYALIEETTPVLLDFNDVYDTQELSQEVLVSLPQQLSSIGVALSTRFDLEDKLIKLRKPTEAA